MEAAGPDSRPRDDAGLYVHVPFCGSICPYCDFAVTRGGRDRKQSYVRAVLAEAALQSHFPHRFDTVYLGGGTPSALEPEDLAALLGGLRRELPISLQASISLEANPEDVARERIESWKALGVSTLSIGVQSFRDQELRFLGRRHDAAGTRRALEAGLAAGFDVVSADLIFGLPGQEAGEWLQSLEEIVRLGPQHVSCYQLTIEERTPFHSRRRKGRLVELSHEVQAELYELAHEALGAAGYEPYEVSNFARAPRFESRHNKKYWNHTPYLGLGLGAHSFSGSRRWWNVRHLREYEARLGAGESPLAGSEPLGPAELALEALFLGLRTREGVDLERLGATSGADLVQVNRERLESYRAAGLARLEGGRLRLTPRGLAVADGIARALELGA